MYETVAGNLKLHDARIDNINDNMINLLSLPFGYFSCYSYTEKMFIYTKMPYPAGT